MNTHLTRITRAPSKHQPYRQHSARFISPQSYIHQPIKAAIDFKFLRDNLPLVEQNTRDRACNANPRKAVELYEESVRLKQETELLRAERNDNSAQMRGKLDSEQREQLITKGHHLKEKLAVLEQRLNQVEAQMQYEGQRVPNMTHPAVPVGNEDKASVLNIVGSQPLFDFPPRDHVALAETLDMVDFDSASEVSGQKFYYLRNAGALLELALVNWAMSKVVARHGYTPVMTPDLVKAALPRCALLDLGLQASVLEKCGFQPRGPGTQTYSIQDSHLCLAGTAEVPLAGMYMDKVLRECDLPIRMVALSHCFRTEAGGAGAAGKGLYRVHQFSKVEMFVLCTPDQSEAMHEELRRIEEELFSELGLHFRVLDMPSTDLGAPAYRKFDVEAWMPGLNRYGEISSSSNCTDYQARRLNIRYKRSPPSKDLTESSQGHGDPARKGVRKSGGSDRGMEFVHTLNGTACAVPRMIIAIMENGQREDGSVVVPKALQPFLGGMEVIKVPTPNTGH